MWCAGELQADARQRAGNLNIPLQPCLEIHTNLSGPTKAAHAQSCLLGMCECTHVSASASAVTLMINHKPEVCRGLCSQEARSALCALSNMQAFQGRSFVRPDGPPKGQGCLKQAQQISFWHFLKIILPMLLPNVSRLLVHLLFCDDTLLPHNVPKQQHVAFCA